MKSIILYDFELQNLLKNGKGQIRRAIPIKFLPGYNPEWTGYQPIFEYGEFYLANSKGEPATKEIKCPFGVVGEEIWCKETWGISGFDDDEMTMGVIYKVDDTFRNVKLSEEKYNKYYDNMSEIEPEWHSSIHMPYEASRLTIVSERVWTERVQEITKGGAIAEGFEGEVCTHPNADEHGCTDCYNTGWIEPPQVGFMQVWDYHNKLKWDANPRVFAAEVRKK
jgi:hypothetical protein